MRRIRLFTAAIALVVVGLGSTLPMIASADTAQQTVCQALDAGNNCSTTPHGSVSLNSIIKTVVNVFSFVIGVVAVIMIMTGGFRYVTAGGDSSKVSSAKSTITYAIIGLVIAALAQSLVRFVLVHVS